MASKQEQQNTFGVHLIVEGGPGGEEVVRIERIEDGYTIPGGTSPGGRGRGSLSRPDIHVSSIETEG